MRKTVSRIATSVFRTKSIGRILIAVLCLLSLSTTYDIRHTKYAFAQTPYGRPGFVLPEEMNDKLERTISLDLRDIHVIDVLKFLSSKAELNIVASQNINARVTLFLKEVSIGSALDIILISTSLAVRIKQQILYVGIS